jgi:lipoate-protein ligase A
MFWRQLVSGPANGSFNMAVDEALLGSVRAGGPPVLRLYRWAPACLSLGRNQTAVGEISLERARQLGITIVRRPTGGLAVLHDCELTYAVIAPTALLGGPRASYLRIHRAILAGLQRLGVAAQLAVPRRFGVSGSARRADRHPCFAEHARGEITVSGRKLVGSAQRADRDALLQHGSVLMSGDQSRVAELHGRSAGADHGISLAELLGTVPAWEDVAAAVAAGFIEHGVMLQPSELGADESARAADLEHRYRDDAWTWRC